MTHQQMIDFWEKQIKAHELNASCGESATYTKISTELMKQAMAIYMQLCQMESDIPKVETSTEFKNISSMNYGDDGIGLTSEQISEL